MLQLQIEEYKKREEQQKQLQAEVMQISKDVVYDANQTGILVDIKVDPSADGDDASKVSIQMSCTDVVLNAFTVVSCCVYVGSAQYLAAAMPRPFVHVTLHLTAFLCVALGCE